MFEMDRIILEVMFWRIGRGQKHVLRFEEAILLYAGPPPKHISWKREKENKRKEKAT